MKRNISDLVEGMAEDALRILPATPPSAASIEWIQEETMKKIKTTGTVQKAVRRGRVWVLAAAIAAAVLAVSAAAAVYLSTLSVTPVEPGAVNRYQDEYGNDVIVQETGVVVEAPATAEACNEVCFQASYLPFDTGDATWISFDEILREHEDIYGAAFDTSLAASGLSADAARQWYSTMWYDADSAFFRIDVYNGAFLSDLDLVFDTAVEVVAQAPIGELEAVYLTADYGAIGTYNHILLYHTEYGCMVDIYGTYSFDELNHVALGLTLYQTDLPALDTSDLDWSAIGIGVG